MCGIETTPKALCDDAIGAINKFPSLISMRQYLAIMFVSVVFFTFTPQLVLSLFF